MAMDPDDFLLSSGVKSAKFAQPGDEVVGHIMRRPEVQHQRDPATGESRYWPDGKPRLQLKVILMTDEHEDDDDTGERAVYIRGQMQQAVAQAVRNAKAAGIEVGGKLMIRYTANGKAPQKGFNPPKQYEAKYRAPEVAEALEPVAAAAPVVDPDEVPF